MKQLSGAFRKWADWFDLPSDVTGGSIRIEMIGNHRLQIQNHKGVEHFHPQILKIRTPQGIMEIKGEELMIKAIFPDTVFIEGKIKEVRYL